MTERTLLHQMALAYRRRRLAAGAMLATGAGVLAAGAAHAAGAATGLPAVGWIAIVATGAAVAATVAAWWFSRRTIGAVEVARHLDRTFPTVEESAELLLEDVAALPLVARLERTRVERALDRAAPLATPRDGTARRGMIGGGAAAVAGALLLLAPRGNGPARSIESHPDAPVRGALIGGVQLRIEPPAYTGAPAREQSGWDADAPEGSLVRWRIAVDAERAWLTTSSGDTIPLSADVNKPDIHEWAANLRARGSVLYQITAERGGVRRVSDFHRLGVQPDTITAPAERTRLAPGRGMRVPVEVHAGDDWGIGTARLVATLTSGEGEAVKFREQVLPLPPTGARGDLPHGLTLSTTIDLAALGLKPGDELYFHPEAADRRTPSPNIARSETVFISLADSGAPEAATLAGIAVSLAPRCSFVRLTIGPMPPWTAASCSRAPLMPVYESWR